MRASSALFGKASAFLHVINDAIPLAATYRYHFIEDASFKRWRDSPAFNIKEQNFILALELVDKAHLAAVTSLVRTKRWADAACLMYESENFIGWASCARGLLESAGDIIEGLLNVAGTLATHHRSISWCLTGDADNIYTFSEPEAALDHFVFAKWGREKESVLTAKSNADYVRLLASVMPDAVEIYRRLCSVTHPAADSINYLFDDKEEQFRLDVCGDIKAIQRFCSDYPLTMHMALMMSCNPPLLILRVLHKFCVHPKLPTLRKFDWSAIPAWAEIEQSLKR
jgi:hypothetical protein